MKNAFVYYYEFTDTDNVYIRFLENSIKLLLKNKILLFNKLNAWDIHTKRFILWCNKMSKR